MIALPAGARLDAIASSSERMPLQKIRAAFPRLDENIDALGRIQGHAYLRRGLAATALLHRSSLVLWSPERDGIQSNERLEFLGDSLVNLFVTLNAVARFPGLAEGRLSRFRSVLVGAASLAAKAQGLGLGELLLLGKGEAQSSGPARINLLADAFEAVTAALYLDAGPGAAESWLGSVFAAEFEQGADSVGEADPKSALQELTQKELGCVPEYRVVEERGQGPDLRFVVAGMLGGRELARAEASSKKGASRLAAERILKQLESQGLKDLLGDAP